ncbi:hypothetical protein H4R20_004725 [Coemansia guatemalensis]|uniref:P-loop containing nucleoside triphosphate hydrolase protein n=1 Tax=Coemansia guatemalensis TaxID=2761395 RepID=A0A9W8LRG9_9FUNG|nr:hypothetical protein H4R20_004725 [Coemansia guatemalensis]
MAGTDDTQPKIAELGDYLLNKQAEQPSTQKRTIVAIAGIPGSGKTRVSQLLCEYLNRLGEICAMAPMDGFHFTKAQLQQQASAKGIAPSTLLSRRGAHWTFDSEGFVSAITRLHKHSDATHLLPSFDHTIGDPVADKIAIHPHHRIVLVEGNYVHLSMRPWNEIGLIADEMWWIAPRSKEVCSNRLAARHVHAGLSESIDAAKTRIGSNDALNGDFAESNRLPPSRTILN